MPHVTVHNRRMTNVALGGGEFVQGIRRNPMDEIRGVSPLAGDAIEIPRSVRPLRYTPGLTCDPHLENLRPERDPRHHPIQGGDNWKRKLIQVRFHYNYTYCISVKLFNSQSAYLSIISVYQLYFGHTPVYTHLAYLSSIPI